jgi:hypothetical protein
MEDVGTLCGHLVYFTAIGYSLWPLGIFYGPLVYFFPIWYVVPRKIWQRRFVLNSTGGRKFGKHTFVQNITKIRQIHICSKHCEKN